METKALVDLWTRARSRGERVFLATVVHVYGSSYRKPGARMLVTSSGERAGTISGGCLEAEVSRKIAWRTRNGSSLHRYQSSFDDENEGIPYGLGCGGTIWILMESGEAVDRVMEALRLSLESRIASVVVYMFAQEEPIATVVFDNTDRSTPHDIIPSDEIVRALSEQKVVTRSSHDATCCPEQVYMPLLPAPRLHVFGAGDDAKPLVQFAAELGWDVRVADGRSHLLKAERFPSANRLDLLPFRHSDATPGAGDLLSALDISRSDLAVILTHSYEQDRALLRELIQVQMQYLGILADYEPMRPPIMVEKRPPR